MKSVARSYFWWPKLDEDIEILGKSCIECSKLLPNPPKAELHNWPWPSEPGQRLHLDFLGPHRDLMFLVILDAYSKWLFVKYMPKIISSALIKVCREYFGM